MHLIESESVILVNIQLFTLRVYTICMDDSRNKKISDDPWPPPPKKKEKYVKKAGEPRNKSYVDRFEELASTVADPVFEAIEETPEPRESTDDSTDSRK